MVESVAETQQLAIRSSFRHAGYGPEQVDLVECHATATPTGDVEEIKALKECYPKGAGVVLSSYKSQIGHTLGSSGLNSLIHGVSAMQAKTFPPTLNYHTPDPDLDLESWGFKVFPKPTPWPHSPHHPRRFQVNAFGFGGANYVIQLEEANWQPDLDDTPAANASALKNLPSQTTISGVHFYQGSHQGKAYRLGTTLPGGALVNEKLTPYLNKLDNLSPQQRSLLSREGIHLSQEKGKAPCPYFFRAGKSLPWHG